MPSREDVTKVLAEVAEGDGSAVDRLFPLVYDELRRLAQDSLRNERSGHTLQATALVHEAYLRLIGIDQVEWQDRAHFFSVAARAIRRVLVDHARQRGCQKRGGDFQKVTLDDVLHGEEKPLTDIIAVHNALDKLAETDEKAAQVVEMRFFAGLTIEEVAAVLQVHARTVDRYWRYGRAWLYREVSGS